uniref:CUB domain-containing protein n=1 Tax=Macrostomum lignano TaxID=282301 RepID=A0A1I8HVB3_9PLAT
DPVCGRPTLASDAAGGQLVSHAGYPTWLLGNGSSLSCAWQLQAPPGSALSVQFESVGLASPDDCVELADPAGWRPQMFACGPAAAASAASVGYISGGPIVSLRAKLQSPMIATGFGPPATGFRLVYRFYKPADCNRQIQVSSANGTVSGNRYLAGNRCPGGLTWRWIFSTRGSGGFALNFLNVSLDEGDCLAVLAGSGRELARRCGAAARPEIQFWPSSAGSTDQLILNFAAAGSEFAGSSSRWSTSGFLVHYAQVSVCNTNGQSVDVTRTSSVEYRQPAPLSGWRFCSWMLTGPPGQQLALWLHPPGLTAADSASCLTVAGGSSSGGSWTRLCGGDLRAGARHRTLVNDNLAKLIYLSSEGDPGFRMAWTLAGTCYPDASYPANMDCNWTVPYSPASMLIASVSRLSLADPSDCLIFNEATGGQRFCGPADLYANATFSISSSDGLSIRFVSGSAGGAGGFQLSVSTVRIRTPAACNATVQISSRWDSGYFDSHPGFGSEPYPNNAECVWQISVSPGAGQLLAWFEELQLEACCDRVHVYEGAMESPGRRLLGSVSSDAAEWPSRTVYNASGGVMAVRLSTDAAGTGRGFRMRYSAAAGLRRNCSSGSLTAPADRLQSHPELGLTGYAGGSNCSWRLVAPSGISDKKLLIRFDRLSLRPGDCVSVRNGPAVARRHCGLAGLDSQSSLLLLDVSTTVTLHFDAPTLDGPFRGSEDDRNRGFALRYYWVSEIETVYRFETASLPSARLNSCAIIERSAGGVFDSRLPAPLLPRPSPLMLPLPSADFGLFLVCVCGQPVWSNSSSGRLRSPAEGGLAFPAIQNISCRWRIPVPAGSRLTVATSGFLLTGDDDCLSFRLGNDTTADGEGVLLRSYCGGGFHRSLSLSVTEADLYIEFRSGNVLQPPLLLDLSLDSLDPTDVGCRSAGVVDLTSRTRGSFVSHRRFGELAYRRGQTCAWRLRLGANNLGINVRLHSVSLHSGDCLQFALENGSQALTLCGANATDRLLRWDSSVAAVKTLQVRFSAPAPTGPAPRPMAGFGVKFDTGEACGPLTWKADRSGGSLVSHTSYGFARYPAGLLCYWRIRASPAYSLAIDIGLLQLGAGDCVHFYEGSRQPAARVGSHCGRDFGGLAPTLPALETADSLLLVEFDSQAGSAGDVGFGLTFRMLKRPVCSGKSRALTAPTDGAPPNSLSSHPQFSRWNYEPNWRCYSELRAPSAGGHVTVWFAADAKLEPGDRDSVQIFDGAAAIGNGSSGKLIRPPADGRNSSARERSTFDVLGVLFWTDYSVEAAGFQLLFTGEARKLNNNPAPFPLAAVIGGAAGGAVLLLAAIIALIVFLVRRSSTAPEAGSSGGQNAKKNPYSREPAAQGLASEFDDDDNDDCYLKADQTCTEATGMGAGTGTGTLQQNQRQQKVSNDRIDHFDKPQLPPKPQKQSSSSSGSSSSSRQQQQQRQQEQPEQHVYYNMPESEIYDEYGELDDLNEQPTDPSGRRLPDPPC